MIEVDSTALVLFILLLMVICLFMGWNLRGLHDLDKEQRENRKREKRNQGNSDTVSR